MGWRIILLLVVFAGCGRTYGQQSCSMEREYTLGEFDKVPGAVAVKCVGNDKYLASWSVEGLWVSLLSKNGKPLGKVVQIQEKTFTGHDEKKYKNIKKGFRQDLGKNNFNAMDIAILNLSPDTSLIAFVKDSKKANPGVFAVVFNHKLRTYSKIMHLGDAGITSNRIALVKSGNHIIAAWQAGKVSSSYLSIAKLGVTPLTVAGFYKIKQDNPVSSPSLSGNGTKTVITWSKTIFESGEAVTYVEAAFLNSDMLPGKIKTIAKTSYPRPGPRIKNVKGGYAILFRDEKDDDNMAEFYHVMLDKNLKLQNSPMRISRADGTKCPAFETGKDFMLSAAVRSYQDTFLVGVNRFNNAGKKLGGEFQLYADKTSFIHVDVTTCGDGFLLVYGEDKNGKGRVFASKLRCK